MTQGGGRLDGADLARGRAAARRRAWSEAFEVLSVADRAQRLGAGDLLILATAAYLVGRVPECLAALQRGCDAHVEAGELRLGARAAFWIAYVLGNQGDAAQAGGWLARATHLLTDEPAECAEHGLVVGAMAFRHMMAGDLAQALATGRRSAEIGRSTGDPDVLGLALTQVGGALVRLGLPHEAMSAFDEAMVAVLSAQISPIAAGTVYCSVISMCGELADLARAREWTDALDAWCEKQPDLAVFSGQCLAHRAELLQWRGRWAEAVEEAERACARLAGAVDAAATGAARYHQAEIHRLSGDFARAELAYRLASEWGFDPCPGLALLRVLQGDLAAGQAALRRALAETSDPMRRARLLPAQVEIALAARERAAAQAAVRELGEIAERVSTPALRAAAAAAHATLLLALGDAPGALREARGAASRWLDLDVPYEVARTRVLIGLACRQMGDHDTATLEFTAATRTFAALGAEPDRRRVDALLASRVQPSHGLTRRELQVLRLVAEGKTNQAIAATLGLSEKTVERHLSNIYTKLGVASRAAATAYVYRHNLA